MSARRLAAAALAFVVVVVAGAAAAWARPSKSGAEHLVRGSRLYNEGRYDEAIAELQAGYAIDPRPDFLYALGQAERKRGDCKAAVAWYERYVATGPSSQRTVATLVQIDRCKQELASATPSTTTTAPPAPATPVEPPPAPERPQASAPPPSSAPLPSEAPATATATTTPTTEAPAGRTPLYKRWWLWTTVAVVVAGGVGAGVAIALTQQPSFRSTLPELTWTHATVGVRF
ncbi:MAG TPA: tetratricopeptide repeat protein [Polyangia bacterium]|nr:tetratricopeptide repeat protein [Polyangia bacterium]